MNDKTKRRSAKMTTTLLAAAAATAMAALNGCSNGTTTARCVGPDGRVLPDSACRGGMGGGVYYGGGYGGGYPRGGTMIIRPQPRWVYGGGGGTGIGSRATGFSTSPPRSGGISTASGTTIRGGFGGEGGMHGGFGGFGHGGG